MYSYDLNAEDERFCVSIQNSEASADTDVNDTILGSLLRAGLGMPYECNSGEYSALIPLLKQWYQRRVLFLYHDTKIHQDNDQAQDGGNNEGCVN